MEKQWGNPSHKEEEEDSEDSDNPEAKILYYKGKQVTGEPVAQNSKAWVQPLAHGASSSVDKESQKDTQETWDHYLHISPDTSHNMEAVSGRSMEENQAILLKIWMWIWLFGKCSWIPLFEQQFISEKTMTRIWDL